MKTAFMSDERCGMLRSNTYLKIFLIISNRALSPSLHTSSKQEAALEKLRQLHRGEMWSRVCITFENWSKPTTHPPPNPSAKTTILNYFCYFYNIFSKSVKQVSQPCLHTLHLITTPIQK